MASEVRDSDPDLDPSGKLDALVSRLRKLAATPGGAEEGSNDPERFSIASSIATDNDDYPSQSTPTSPHRENVVSTLDSAGSTSTPLEGIKIILIMTNTRIWEDANKALEIMKHMRNFRIQADLIPSLERCQRVGTMVEDLLKRKKSNLTEFGELGNRFASYVKELEKITQKIPSLSETDNSRLSTLLPWRPYAEDDLQRAARKLKITLREVRPTVELLNLSVQVGTYREALLQEELRRTKEQLNFVGRRSVLPPEQTCLLPSWASLTYLPQQLQ
jgi:hypothetical protein